MTANMENPMLYSCVENTRYVLEPFRYYIKLLKRYNKSMYNPNHDSNISRMMSANFELLNRLTKRYRKPEFGIKITRVNDHLYEIDEQTVMNKSFCNLLHFKKLHFTGHQQKMLIVAPLSGHYSTLLRGTVTDLLPFYDVYITDWVNAREVPMSEGTFDLDDYIDYVMDFTKFVGDDVNILAVCQPTVPVAAAVSLMAEDKESPHIRSMILVGGPIDARLSPTKINEFASTRAINWFESKMITRVPMNYPGFMRAVYPGFIQLSGFMSMNMQRHIGEHMKLYQHLVVGDGESADYHRKFYDEYLAVLDIPAEFYLQTLEVVFHNFDLPMGNMVSRDRKVVPKSVTKTALMVIEGELDDISGIGQTKAAINLFSNIPDDHKYYHLQKGVGHYGVFNGSKFRKEIVPAMHKFTTEIGHLNHMNTNNKSEVKNISKQVTKKSSPKKAS
jgi:poly(3-hydroxybutyrate) depolymerase